eukprot:SAG31_NODE_1609_length_7753_cov_12.390253_9_plen_49_part_00
MLKVIQREQVLEQNVISQFRAAKLGKLVVSGECQALNCYCMMDLGWCM